MRDIRPPCRHRGAKTGLLGGFLADPGETVMNLTLLKEFFGGYLCSRAVRPQRSRAHTSAGDDRNHHGHGHLPANRVVGALLQIARIAIAVVRFVASGSAAACLALTQAVRGGDFRR